MTVSANEVANYFIELASKIDENDLTNLKLQKLLYFAQGEHLKKDGKPLFGEPIEAWELGPVVASVYENYKECGPFPITAFDNNVKRAKIESGDKSFIEKVWDEYGKYSAGHLVDLTHEESSPWKKVYKKGKNQEIPNDLIKEYFQENTKLQ